MHIINNHNYEMPYLENYKREKKNQYYITFTII